MLILYDQKETDFSTNGLGVLMPVKAEVTEELNGMYELELTCYAAENNKSWQHLNEMNIIKSPSPKGSQLFRIYRVVIKEDNSIHVNARHIFYDGLFNYIEKKVLGTFSSDDAIKKIYESLAFPTPFVVGSGMTGSSQLEIYDVNPVSALLGLEGFIDAYGGEIERDNFNIHIKGNLGRDRGFQVRFRKNLIGLDYETNIEKTATKIKPKGTDKNGDPLFLPELYINSPRINDYPFPLIALMEFSDIRVGDEMTYNQAIEEMRKRVHAFYAVGGDLPFVNAKVNFVLLKNTEAYKEYALLEEIFLGDTVTVIHENLNVALKSKCIKYIYDAILKRYTQIELGSFRDDITSGTGRVDRTTGGVSSTALNVQGNFDTLFKGYNELLAKLASHKHKGAAIDGTNQISSADILK